MTRGKGMPHQDKSARAQRRLLQRTVAHLGGQARSDLALRRERNRRRIRAQEDRYRRLSAARLIELGERAGLVEEKEEEDQSDTAYD